MNVTLLSGLCIRIAIDYSSTSVLLIYLRMFACIPVLYVIVLSKSTKIHLYTSMVIPSAIYASETWRTTDKTNRMLNVFNRRCLREIMGVSWRDHMTNEELLRAGVGDLQDIVATRRRRFIGHVLRLPTSRPASLVIDWTPEDGAGQSGRGGTRSWKTWEQWVLVAMALMTKSQVLPVIVPNGDNSSPSVPAIAGGPKSK